MKTLSGMNAPFAPYPPYPPYPAYPNVLNGRSYVRKSISQATQASLPDRYPETDVGRPETSTAGPIRRPTDGAWQSVPADTFPPAITEPPKSRTGIDLAELSADPGYHEGTGDHSRSVCILEPVAVTDLMGFATKDFGTTNLLFQIAEPAVPNWYGVGVPNNLTTISDVLLFFHPIPSQAGYRDDEYQHKGNPTYSFTGTPWSRLYYIVERLTYQFAASKHPRMVILPFLTSSATDTGILLTQWQDIMRDIIDQTAFEIGKQRPVWVSQDIDLVIASHSVGIEYLYNFYQRTSGLRGPLTGIWDFDGRTSTAEVTVRRRKVKISDVLQDSFAERVIKYDEGGGSGQHCFHTSEPHWKALPVPVEFPPYTDTSDIHHLIRDFFVLHASETE